MNNYKITELETLNTFQEEIPSIYFSHKEPYEFNSYVEKMEYMYRNLFKFPPKMFNNAELIDFGSGTGENTIYLANWGAKCTLVEMNNKAQKISKEVFSKHAKHPEDHSFVCSSIFEYSPSEKKQYDIVHCRGVLAHTSEKEKAFKIISSYVKPGGYIIFGDPNKSGGFQNMLQRYAVYSFSSTVDEMVDISELLFKEDIDRSEEAVPRTRRAIIFDRWAIQQQDDPSISEVNSWMSNSGLQMYSTYPPSIMPIVTDSYLDNRKIDPYKFDNLFTIPELAWMMRTDNDSEFLSKMNSNMEETANAFSSVTGFMENTNSHSSIDLDDFTDRMNAFSDNSIIASALAPLQEKLSVFSKESIEFIKIVQKGKVHDVRKFIENTRYLFKGACGVRHSDFIGYKPPR
jgi:2-polyprenyl-3-methyl-5-hydroxy-6-metoxy-1,4-benzoquinol methylase